MAFSDIPVSTQTFTVRSNIQHIELHRFYDELQPSSPGDVDGARASIICIKYQQHKKGCDPDLKTKRKRTTSKDQDAPKRNFLNSITLMKLPKIL